MNSHRPVWAEISLGAIADNVRALREFVHPAEVLAVVKADAYGHGAVPVAKAALAGGASGLGVALVEEGIELREAEIDAPIVMLSEPVPDAADVVVQRRITPVVYTPRAIDALARAVAASELGTPFGVHLKIDTGMHRVGCAPDDALDLARLVAEHPELHLAGTCTHFAMADEQDDDYTVDQIRLFDSVLDVMRAARIDPGVVHACNSAGALAFPAARYDMVRPGISVYGVAPAAFLEDVVELRPAMSIKARVSYVKTLPSQTPISYGLRYETRASTRIATVPIGYADGVPRALGAAGGEALVRGHRRPIAGTVTMDQLMLDVGDAPVEAGDEVVLLGCQGGERVTATEWAGRLGTLANEIVCRIGPRVPRTFVT